MNDTMEQEKRVVRTGCQELGRAIEGGITKITLLDEGSLISCKIRELRREVQLDLVRALNEKITRRRDSSSLGRIEGLSVDEALVVDAQAALDSQFMSIQTLGAIIKHGKYAGRTELERHIYASLTPQNYAGLQVAVREIHFNHEKEKEVDEELEVMKNRTRYGLVLLSQPEVRSFFRKTTARDLLRIADPIHAYEDAMLYAAAFEWI